MEDLDKTNLVLSILYLKDASMLLKQHETEISDALLKLSKSIIEKNNLLSTDIQTTKTLAKDIADEPTAS